MFDLSEYEIDVTTVHRNAPPAALYQDAFRLDIGTTLSDTGALIAYSGDKTGRSPKDKRVVEHPESAEDVWWGLDQYRARRVEFLCESRASD